MNKKTIFLVLFILLCSIGLAEEVTVQKEIKLIINGTNGEINGSIYIIGAGIHYSTSISNKETNIETNFIQNYSCDYNSELNNITYSIGSLDSQVSLKLSNLTNTISLLNDEVDYYERYAICFANLTKCNFDNDNNGAYKAQYEAYFQSSSRFESLYITERNMKEYINSTLIDTEEKLNRESSKSFVLIIIIICLVLLILYYYFKYFKVSEPDESSIDNIDKVK